MADLDDARAFPGRFFLPSGRTFSTASASPTVNTLIALPFSAGVEIDALALQSRFGGSADAVVRAGIYESDSLTGLPTTLVEDAGEFALNGHDYSTIVMPLSAPHSPAAPYWVVALFGGTTAPSMGGASMVASECQRLFGAGELSTGIFNANGINCVKADFDYDALPETFPTPVLAGSNLLLVVRSTAAA